MTKNLDVTEVAVLSEDGRDELLATFHGWQQRDGENGKEWWGDVFVYGPDGSYRDTLPAHRLVPLVYCGRLPDGEIRHTPDCKGQAGDQVEVT